MQYTAMAKKRVDISRPGLTYAEKRKMLEDAVKDLFEQIQTKFPRVPILGALWLNTTVLLDIQDPALIPAIEAACDCTLRENRRLKME